MADPVTYRHCRKRDITCQHVSIVRNCRRQRRHIGCPGVERAGIYGFRELVEEGVIRRVIEKKLFELVEEDHQMPVGSPRLQANLLRQRLAAVNDIRSHRRSRPLHGIRDYPAKRRGRSSRHVEHNTGRTSLRARS